MNQSATPPQLPPPEVPQVNPPPPPPPPAPPPRRTARHKPKPATPAQGEQQQNAQAQPSPAAATQQAAAGTPSDVSPIGQLTTTGDSASALSHQKILDQINSTEKGLNGIKRSLSSEEQVTAAQIRTFLEKAKHSLAQDDLDGANTLVTKAKVLLDELTKQ